MWWRLGLLCLLATGCAGSQLRPPQDREIDFVILEGDALLGEPGPVGGRAEEMSWSDLNSSPIHVWVYRDKPGGLIQRIRVTGHAVEQYCAEASKALIEFHQKHQIVSGFLTFGVDDSYPRGPVEPFAKEAEMLLKKLRPLSTAAPDQVVIHELVGPADATFSQPPPRIMPNGVGAVLGSQPFTSGPAFVPVRAWNGVGAAQPLRFELSLTELGLAADQLNRLASDVDLGPWVEQAELMKEEARKMELLLEAHKASSEFTDNVWVYKFFINSYSVSEVGPWQGAIAQIREANSRMHKLLRKYQVLEAIEFVMNERPGPAGKKKKGLSSVQRERIQEIQKAIKLNETCLSRLQLRTHCTWAGENAPEDGSFMDVALMQEEDPKKRAFLAKLTRQLQELSATELSGRRTRALQALEQLSSSIGTIQQRRTSGALKAARERVIDGLLRGWPLPASTDEDALFSDSFTEQRMPEVWKLLLTRLEDSQGTHLREEGRMAGKLQRANVFFRVQELAPGRYEVLPMYIVGEAYAEVWDTNRHTVTIETPFGLPMELAEKESP